MIIIVAKFTSDTKKQNNHVKRQGGMQYKYRVLIDFVLSGDSRAKIFKETNSFISVGTSTAGGTTLFDITQTYGNVTIKWNVNSPLFGKHSLKWEFDEFLDQMKMIEKIENDLLAYQNNVMTADGFPDFNK